MKKKKSFIILTSRIRTMGWSPRRTWLLQWTSQWTAQRTRRQRTRYQRTRDQWTRDVERVNASVDQRDDGQNVHELRSVQILKDFK